MKLALIPPISLLEYTDETFCQLMLPHLIEDDAYTYVYRQHCQDPNQFVILDNGVAEDELAEWAHIYAIATDFGVDEIVIPDVMEDWLATIASAKRWHSEGFVDDQIFRYMFVAQGRNAKQFKASIDWAMEQDWIKTIGLPRHSLVTVQNPQIRQELSRYIQRHDHFRGQAVHLLGAAPFYPVELMDLNFPPCVRSTDTSSPFNFTFAGAALRRGNVHIRPKKYFHLAASKFDEELLEKNVQKLMTWTGNDL